MGLAFAPLAATQSIPFWQTLLTNGQLDTPEMGFWFTRSTLTPADIVPGGVFTLGGTNSSLYTGNIEFTNLAVTTPTYWALSLTGGFPILCPLTTVLLMGDGHWIGVTAQGQNIAITPGASALASIDTGAVLIGGPPADVRAIYSAIPGSQVLGQGGFWAFRTALCLNLDLSHTHAMQPALQPCRSRSLLGAERGQSIRGT